MRRGMNLFLWMVSFPLPPSLPPCFLGSPECLPCPLAFTHLLNTTCMPGTAPGTEENKTQSCSHGTCLLVGETYNQQEYAGRKEGREEGRRRGRERGRKGGRKEERKEGKESGRHECCEGNHERRIVWGDKEVAMATWKVDAAHSLPAQVPPAPCLSQMSLLTQGTGISLLSLHLTSDFMASISCASCFHFPSLLFDCQLLEGSAVFFFF